MKEILCIRPWLIIFETWLWISLGFFLNVICYKTKMFYDTETLFYLKLFILAVFYLIIDIWPDFSFYFYKNLYILLVI